MKIIFEKIAIKNFLSFGNGLTEVNLRSAPFNLIVGENGSGKSTIIVDALHFALYGKIIRRGIKQDQVINTINGRSCYAKLEFKINDDSYILERGLEPAILNLLKNGEKPDVRSSKKLVQKEIEDLLGCDQNTFKSLCILSLNNSKAFVDLEPAETRNVIENLLGIQVYSLMLEETKKQLKEWKDKLKALDKDYSLYSELYKDNATKLDRAEQIKTEFAQKQLLKIQALEEELTRTANAIQYRQDSLSNKNNVLPLNPDLAKYEQMLNIIKEKIEASAEKIHSCDKIEVHNQGVIDNNRKIIEQCEKDKRFFRDSDNCPICNSPLTENHKMVELAKIEVIHSKARKESSEAFIAMKLARKDSEKETIILVDWKNKEIAVKNKINAIVEQYNIDLRNYNSAEMQYKTLEAELQGYVRSLDTLKERIESAKKETVDGLLTGLISSDKVKEYGDKFEAVKKDKETTEDSIAYYEMVKNLLSDGGIKSTIIKRDLPFLNSTINSYLKEFGRNYAIEFDDAFNIKITGYAKRGLSYYNLSEGEKKRIDLAILLSFIDLAKRKNSIDINILVFDEIFDTSLDVAGQDAFVKMLERKIKTGIIENVFIISHDRNLVLPQAQIVNVYKDGEFSMVTVEK